MEAMMDNTEKFSSRIVCAYLYVITQYGYPPPAAETIKHLKQMADLGFTAVELEGIRREHLTEMASRVGDILKAAGDLGLQIPVFCTVLPGLSSPEASERDESLELFRRGCETAAILGAECVLDNAPLPPWRFPGDVPVSRHYGEEVVREATLPKGLIWRDYWRELVATYAEGCDIASSFGLTYHMHPALGVLASTAEGYELLANAVDRPNLRFNLDTANQFALHDSLPLALHRLADQIDYIHLSDNGGKRIEHLELGKGVIPWDTFFAAVEEVGFGGRFGLDIGGDESAVENLDQAYLRSARWVQERISA